MAAKFDIYNLNSPMVTPTAPAPQAATATAPRTTTARRAYWNRVANDALFNGSVATLVCGGIVYLLGLILSTTPIGQVTPEQNPYLWLGVILVGLLLSLLLAIVLAVTVKVAAKRVRA